MLSGGGMFESCDAFVKLCEARDPGERKARARLSQKPFIELDGERPISENVNIILDYINKHSELSP